jgi:hypothetical protein
MGLRKRKATTSIPQRHRRAAASSSVAKASAKKVRSARDASGDQSALLRATLCQSSRIAILVIVVSCLRGVGSGDRRSVRDSPPAHPRAGNAHKAFSITD